MSDFKEKLMNLTVAETVSYAVAVIAALVGIIALIATVAKTGSYHDTLFAMESQRTQLKGQLSQSIGMEQDAEQVSETSEDGTPIQDDGAADIIVTGKGSAQSAGVSVANFQNRYIPASLDRAEGMLSSDTTARTDAYNMLLPYFAEGYESFAESWYDPMYAYQNGIRNNFMWEFNCKYSFEGSQLPVIWTCRHVNGKGPNNENFSNELVAYATGVYDLNTNKFSGMKTYITEAGKTMAVGYVEPKEVALPPEDEESVGTDEIFDSSVSGNDLEGMDSQQDSETSSEEDLWGDDDEANMESEVSAVEGNNANNGESVLDEGDYGGLPENFFQ